MDDAQVYQLEVLNSVIISRESFTAVPVLMYIKMNEWGFRRLSHHCALRNELDRARNAERRRAVRASRSRAGDRRGIVANSVEVGVAIIN